MIGRGLVVPIVAGVVDLDGKAAEGRAFDGSVDRGGVGEHSDITRVGEGQIGGLGCLLQLTIEKQATY